MFCGELWLFYYISLWNILMDLSVSLVDTESVESMEVSCMLENWLFGPRGLDPCFNIIEEFFTRTSRWCNYLWCVHVVSRGYGSVPGAKSHIPRIAVLVPMMISVVGGRWGAWGKCFEKMFITLDREGGMSFQITGTSVVVSTETCDVTGCVVAGARIWDVTWCESPSSSAQLTRSSKPVRTHPVPTVTRVITRSSAKKEPPEIPWWVGLVRYILC